MPTYLSGYQGFYRVSSGEYPIVYMSFPDQNLVKVILVYKRNDYVYKKFKRLLA
ncbi:type II toxin-antitoxin system RelE family toxin [Nostoc sp. CCY 9925]|uniref:type II toxin-antitoxin system RelE family toxin n=1 Tax=Nostoc sp. CCY 9925 TaxID=3103865 RepID=UPI0039C754AD